MEGSELEQMSSLTLFTEEETETRAGAVTDAILGPRNHSLIAERSHEGC